MKNKLSITEWALDDRPREKLMAHGISALSNAELIAILIGSGSDEDTAVSLAQKMLANADNNLNELSKWEINDFSKFRGMGPAKSISIMAALELGRRKSLQELPEKMFIMDSDDTVAVFKPLLADLTHEEIWIAILDAKSRIITKVRIASGTADHVRSYVSDIFREVILNRGCRLVVVHNHTSEAAEPSADDIEFTIRVYEACKVFKVLLEDHVIITRDECFSMAEAGILKNISNRRMYFNR